MTNPDFKDLLAVFFVHDVRYMVVGAYAMAFHARPRFTKDLDLWIEPSEDNAARAFASLPDFGAPLTEMSSGDLTDPEVVYQIGVPPNRIDILTSVSIPNGGTVAAGMQVILTDVSIHAPLGYQLDDNQVIMNVRDAIEIVLSAEAMKPLKLVLERKR